MPRVSRGSIYKQSRSQNWFIRFYVDGKEQRETTGTPNEDDARAFLHRRIEEATLGRFIERSQRITFTELRDRMFENYRFKGNRTDPMPRVARLTEFFGSMLGEDITEERIREYSRKRLDRDGAAPATLHRELSVLRRMLKLSASRLPRVPLIDMPRVHNARQGFFEEEHLKALIPHLPPHARNLVEFLYLTGWRSGEAFRAQWADVDWARQAIHLRDSKNREPRVFPFRYHQRLETVLRRQRNEVTRWEMENDRICPHVFHWRGNRIQKLRRSWQNACARAGMPGRLLHDFRRTAVRNLIRAGVQQSIAMKITGHKTGSIFRRYLIVDEDLLAQATGAVAHYLEEAERNRED